MALRTASMSGFWDLAATWGGAAPPTGIDTFATSTWTVTARDGFGAVGCAGGTITLGGTLIDATTAASGNLTFTGAVAHNGTFTMLGNGSNVAPIIMTINGCVWTCGTAAIWNVVGTLPYTAPDVKIVGNATSYIYFVLRSGISGTITKCQFSVFGHGNGVFYALNNYPGTSLVVSDLLFSSIPAGGCCIRGTSVTAAVRGTVTLTGNILIDSFGGAGSAVFYITNIYGSASITITNYIGVAIAQYVNICGSIRLVVNGSIVANAFFGFFLYDSAYLSVSDMNNDAVFGSTFISSFSNLSTISLTTLTNARVFLPNLLCNTLGSLALVGVNGLTAFGLTSRIDIKSLTITVTTGTVILTTSYMVQTYWQASRSVYFAIIGSTAITPVGASAISQYEPVLYIYDNASYLFGIQYDLNSQSPNYTALYGASTGWTAATKTLAAGGVLRIYSTGHTATGMDMAISDLSGFALATTGTAAYVATYQISFDGGVLWSAEITLAQLQSNSYIINGNAYTTDSRFDIQIRIILTSAGGGTVTQVRATGIEYDPVQVSSWNVRDELQNEIEGTGFVTATDSLNAISDKIGIPIALDAGLATLAGNMTKIADDNNGADFNAATDSLHELSHSIAAIAAAIAALLAPILRGVEWLIMSFKKVFKHKL